MPVLNFSGLDSNDDLDEQFAEITKLLDYLLNGMLDVANIRAKSLTAEVIKAGSITADEMTVAQLSAITADLGTITAGLMRAVTIIGSYIATRDGTYPRAEMSNTSNLFGAYGEANKYVKIESNLNTLGAPMANFGFDGIETWLTQIGSGFLVFGPNSNVSFSVNNLSLGGKVQVSGAYTRLGTVGVPAATDPDDAVVRLNQLNAILRLMGILA